MTPLVSFILGIATSLTFCLGFLIIALMAVGKSSDDDNFEPVSMSNQPAREPAPVIRISTRGAGPFFCKGVTSVKVDRRRIRRSTIKPQAVAAYAAGEQVKNILMDLGIRHRSHLYRALAEFGVPLRLPQRSAAIRHKLSQSAS